MNTPLQAYTDLYGLFQSLEECKQFEIHPLKVARHYYQLSREELAVHTLVSSSTIKRAEAGNSISDYAIAQLCKFFTGQTHRDVQPHDLGLQRRRSSSYIKLETQLLLVVKEGTHLA